MTAPANFYADFKGLAALKHAATQQDPKALREAARQFESVFTQMMLKSMRDASAGMGESLMDNEQSKFYLEMFDNQLAVQLSKGRGLGLAEMMVKQLMQAGLGGTPTSEVQKSSANESMPAPQATPIAHVAPAKQSMSGPSSQPSSQPKEQSVLDPVTSKAVEESPTISAATAPAAKSAAASVAMTPDEFVRNMWRHAQTAGEELGVDPQTLIAHAALETGWGKSIPCGADGTCSYNLFGIKTGSRWQGDSVRVDTLEYEGGIAVRKRESFRAYSSPEESFRDYAKLLKNNPRYDAALNAGANVAKFAAGLQQGGYATDPAYAQKLTKTALGVVERVSTLLKSAAAQPLAFGKSVSIGGER